MSDTGQSISPAHYRNRYPKWRKSVIRLRMRQKKQKEVVAVIPTSTGTECPLAMQMFGPLEVHTDGQPLPRLHSRKGLWVLAVLTLRQGVPVERSWLAALLWEDSLQDKALTNLRLCLTDLRRALGTEAARLYAPSPRTLALDLTDAQVDMVAFDAAILRGDVSAFENAIALYRGVLLEGCEEDWIQQDRQAREQSYCKALETLAQSALDAFAWDKAASFLRKMIVADPLRESAQCSLMRALAQSGDYAAVTQVYRDFRWHLHSELNTQPDPETTLLYQQLRNSRIPLAQKSSLVPSPAPGCYLPCPLTHLVGRTQEIGAVTAGLRLSRLVTLTGTGGVGKTRLAIAVAEAIVEDYKDGVWFVNLAPISDASLAPQVIAALFAIREEAGHSRTETLMGFLKSKNLLLVLDNCEHILEGCAHLVESLVSSCPNIRILATTRQPLGLTGERIWRVPSLSMPDAQALSVQQKDRAAFLLEFEAPQLFLERALAIAPTFQIYAENAATIASVCRRVDGLPLALELAAARLRSLSIEELDARLEDQLGLLTGGSRTALPRHRTLRALLDWSYDLLSAPEKELLQRLSVFAGGWSLESADVVCAGTDNFRWEILDGLTDLIDKSLVVAEVREGRTRYGFLETVRQYAAEKLQANGGVETLQGRHRDWFAALAEEAEPHLTGSDQVRWLRRLDTEHDNLRAALSYAADGEGSAVGLRLASALCQFWLMRNCHAEGRAYLAKAQSRYEISGLWEARAKALKAEGRLAHKQGDYEAAKALYEQSLVLYRDLDDKEGIAGSLMGMGNVALDQSEYTPAAKLYHESLTLYRSLGDKKGIAGATGNLGLVAVTQRNYTAAKVFQAENLILQRELGNSNGIANSLTLLGGICAELGDYEQATAQYKESLALYEELGYRFGVAYNIGNMAEVARDKGDYENAGGLFQKSLQILREVGDKEGIASTLGNLGRLALLKRDCEEAKRLLETSLDLYREIRNRQGSAEILEALASLRLASSDALKAVILWGTAHMLRESTGIPLSSNERVEYDRQVKQARLILGKARFTTAWEEGRALAWE